MKIAHISLPILFLLIFSGRVHALDAIAIDENGHTTMSGAVDIAGPATFHQPILLTPAASVGAPITGTWQAGTLLTDSAFDVWQCIQTGTPGIWRKVFPGLGGGGTGSTGQVAQANFFSTTMSTSSTSWVSSGVVVTMAPVVGQDSKVIVRCSGSLGTNQSTGSFHYLTIYREKDGVLTNIAPTPGQLFNARSIAGADIHCVVPFSLEILDAPLASSTSTLKYHLYWKVGGGTQYLGRRGSTTELAMPTVITAQEILTP